MNIKPMFNHCCNVKISLSMDSFDFSKVLTHFIYLFARNFVYVGVFVYSVIGMCNLIFYAFGMINEFYMNYIIIK